MIDISAKALAEALMMPKTDWADEAKKQAVKFVEMATREAYAETQTVTGKEKMLDAIICLACGFSDLCAMFDLAGNGSPKFREDSYCRLWSVMFGVFMIGNEAVVSNKSLSLMAAAMKQRNKGQKEGAAKSGAAKKNAADELWRNGFLQLAISMRATDQSASKQSIVDKYRFSHCGKINVLPTTENAMKKLLLSWETANTLKKKHPQS